jgi:Flp pilus assembly protein TadD
VGVACALLLALLLAGCAGLQTNDPSNKLSDQQRHQRNEQALHEFEHNRDAAELLSAQTHYQQGDLDGAREILQRLLTRNEKHTEARLLLAEVEIAASHPDAAREHAERVVKSKPDDPQAHYTLGLALDAAGKPAEAAVHYERAAKLDPQNDVYAASYQTAQGKPAKEPAPLPSDVAAAPTGKTATEASAEEGWQRYQAEQAAHPHDAQIVIRAAVLSLRSNQAKLAVRILSDGARQFPADATILRNLGVAHFRLGDYHASQVALQQAIALDKSSALSYFLLGCTLAKLGQEQAADAEFRQAELLDPKYTVRR